MTKEQQRIAIAEHCGFQNIVWTVNATPRLVGTRRDAMRLVHRGEYRDSLFDVPDYPNDLNAMHEAEKTLGNGPLERYEKHLIILSQQVEIEWITGRSESFNTASRWSWHAPAAMRSEAFVRTIGKWTDA